MSSEVRIQFAIRMSSLLLVSNMTAGTLEQQHRETAELYQRGLAGDKTAVVACIDKLEVELKANPTNYLARVYLGSAYTLRSRDLGFGPTKLQTLNRGIVLMDEAVASAPDDTKIRLARALTTQSLPFFTGKAASSRKDFELLAAAAERAPQNFDDGDLQIIFYNAAFNAKANGNRDRAAAFFKLASAYNADAALAKKIARALADR